MKEVRIVFDDAGDVVGVKVVTVEFSQEFKISVGESDPKPTSIRLSGPAREASIRRMLYASPMLSEKLESAILSYRGNILRLGDTVQFTDPAVGIQDVICDKMAYADASLSDRDVADIIATTVLRRLPNKSISCRS